MKNILLKLCVILSFCILFASSNYGKNYGTITKILMTATTESKGSISMNYTFEVKFADDLTEPINTIEIPMLSSNFSIKNKTQYVSDVIKKDDVAIVKLAKSFSAGQTAKVSFMVNYTKMYTINKKNEAVYKFKFPAIKNYNVEQAKLKWKIDSCIHSNNTSKEEGYRYWDLKSLNIFSKQVFVKYSAIKGDFPLSNAQEKNLKYFLSNGGFFAIIFIMVVICAIIPSDSYRRNSGFRFVNT